MHFHKASLCLRGIFSFDRRDLNIFIRADFNMNLFIVIKETELSKGRYFDIKIAMIFFCSFFIDSIFEIENFMDWIDNDDNLKSLDFGDSVNLLELDVMQNVPTILVDSEQNLAKYQFQARIKYIQN